MKQLLVVAALIAAGVISGADFEKFWAENKDNLWKISPAELPKKIGMKLDWTDAEKNTLRYSAPSRNKSSLNLFGNGTREAQFAFKDGKLNSVYLSVYNRGDDGSWNNRMFNQARLKLQNEIPGAIGAGEPLKDRAYIGGNAHNMRYWKTPQAVWYVKWSESRNEPEYLTVMVNNPELPIESVKQSMRSEVTMDSVGEKLQVDEKGYHFLAVPMVDQGKKGYCAAATVSRIMQYYGADIDQHVIAQIANTDANQGTQVDDIFKALDKAKSKLRVRIDNIWEWDYFESFDSTCRFISEYNNVARKMKKERLKEDDFVTRGAKAKTIFPGKVLAAALRQPDVYKEMRMRDRSGMKKFREGIVEYIDQGIPLIWLVPGHMRIINGYNNETNEIIYSDSWGAGHEKKIMPMDDAWALTSYLFVLRPRGR